MARISIRFVKRTATLGAILAIGVAFFTAQANAVPLTWYFDNATFDDGGIATGNYMFDADTGNFSNISVTTSGGSITGHTYNFIIPGFANASFPEFTTTSSADLTNAPLLAAGLASSMTNAGGTIAINLIVNSGEGVCVTANCSALTGSRFWASGSVTTINPIPLPGALPLFATGLGALGLLGWRRKRKQAAA